MGLFDARRALLQLSCFTFGNRLAAYALLQTGLVPGMVMQTSYWSTKDILVEGLGALLY